MIRYLRLRAWLCLFLVSLMILVKPFAVFADVMTPSNAFAVNSNYLIGSASNADPYGIALLDLYDVAPLASGGTVSNTVNTVPHMYVEYMNPSTGVYSYGYPIPTLSNNRFSFNFKAPTGCCITQFGYSLLGPRLAADYGKGVSLPSPGNYNLSFDFSSDFAYDYSLMRLRAEKSSSNVATQNTFINLSPSFYSGDVYLSPFAVSLINLDYLGIQFIIPIAENVGQIGGSFAIHFEQSSSSGASTGIETPEEDYSADISSSIDSAVEELQYISTSQNLIIQGIDNVIMHISDQLYAFWDQLYNLIHEPTYARLGDILDAIRNLDLEITVEMTEVTNAVNKMNQDMQNKLQNVQQTLTGGYDNSGINQDQAALDSSLQEYDQAEQNVLDNVNDSLNSFEFDSGMDEYKTSIQVFSDFLQALYESAGAFQIVINLSLMLSVAGIVIGLYRFKDGG